MESHGKRECHLFLSVELARSLLGRGICITPFGSRNNTHMHIRTYCCGNQLAAEASAWRFPERTAVAVPVLVRLPRKE
jgi:hypothetical protein